MWGFPLQALPYVSGVQPIERIKGGVVSAAASLDITDLPAGFRAFDLLFDDLLPATDGATLYLRTSTDNGSTWANTNYDGNLFGQNQAGAGVGGELITSAAQLTIGPHTTNTFGNAAGEQAAGGIEIFGARDSGQKTKILWRIVGDQTDGTVVQARGGGRRSVAEDTDAFQLLFDSGNIASMNWTLYGWRA